MRGSSPVVAMSKSTRTSSSSKGPRRASSVPAGAKPKLKLEVVIPTAGATRKRKRAPSTSNVPSQTPAKVSILAQAIQNAGVLNSQAEKKLVRSTPATTPSRTPTKVTPIIPTPAIPHIDLRAQRPNPNARPVTKTVFKIGPPKGKRPAKLPVVKPQIVAEPPLTPESIAPEVPPSSSPQSPTGRFGEADAQEMDVQVVKTLAVDIPDPDVEGRISVPPIAVLASGSSEGEGARCDGHSDNELDVQVVTNGDEHEGETDIVDIVEPSRKRRRVTVSAASLNTTHSLASGKAPSSPAADELQSAETPGLLSAVLDEVPQEVDLPVIGMGEHDLGLGPLDDLDSDFQYLNFSEVVNLPWMNVDTRLENESMSCDDGGDVQGFLTDASIFVPPGLGVVLNHMKLSLKSETASRVKAEARLLEEIQKLARAEQRNIDLEAENKLLRAEHQQWSSAITELFSSSVVSAARMLIHQLADISKGSNVGGETTPSGEDLQGRGEDPDMGASLRPPSTSKDKNKAPQDRMAKMNPPSSPTSSDEVVNELSGTAPDLQAPATSSNTISDVSNKLKQLSDIQETLNKLISENTPSLRHESDVNQAAGTSTRRKLTS